METKFRSEKYCENEGVTTNDEDEDREECVKIVFLVNCRKMTIVFWTIEAAVLLSISLPVSSHCNDTIKKYLMETTMALTDRQYGQHLRTYRQALS